MKAMVQIKTLKSSSGGLMFIVSDECEGLDDCFEDIDGKLQNCIEDINSKNIGSKIESLVERIGDFCKLVDDRQNTK